MRRSRREWKGARGWIESQQWHGTFTSVGEVMGRPYLRPAAAAMARALPEPWSFGTLWNRLD